MPSLVMPYMVLYGCSPWFDPWLDACAEVALFAAAHPAATTAMAASAVAARMQDNARLKTFPLTDTDIRPISQAIKRGYGARKAKNTAEG